MLIVFGFYTDDPVYEKHAMMLKASAYKFGIELELHKVLQDDWQTIIAYKTKFIAEMRRRLNGPILYIDVDALILEDIRPYFLNIQEDIAVHYLDDAELISATIFLNDTPATYALINEWEQRQKENPDIWDQVILENILNEWEGVNKITIHKLSPSYTFIYDTSLNIYGNEYKPAIEHYQASRDKRWLTKYKSRSLFQQWLMRIPNLRRGTRKIMRRHDHVNKRLKELEVNMSINIRDILP